MYTLLSHHCVYATLYVRAITQSHVYAMCHAHSCLIITTAANCIEMCATNDWQLNFNYDIAVIVATVALLCAVRNNPLVKTSNRRLINKCLHFNSLPMD